MSVAAATRARRRNGSEASCEPCRISKLKCDHARPVCNRCRKRALQSECFYHPAPLTKSYPHNVQHSPDHARPTHANDVASSTFRSKTPSSISRRPAASLITDDDRERISLISEVLDALRHFDLIRKSVNDYYLDGLAANIPSPLLLPAVSSMERLVGVPDPFQQLEDRSTPHLQRLAQAIMSSLRRTIHITSATTLEDFVSWHTGPNIRLEFLGILYSIAGRAYISSMSERGVQDAFMQAMTRCAGICYRMARELAPLSDALVWLSLEWTTLVTNVYGDKSEEVWQSLGDMSSDVLAFNLHRERHITQDCPFFLSECRRRTSSKSYYLDVCISSLLDRPPRLHCRFFDVQLPLDFSDEEVVSAPDALMAARSKLSPSGWNMGSDYFPASIARLRPAIAQVRGEAWEQGYDSTTSESVAHLEELSRRNRQIWDDVPVRLRYNSACWRTGVPPRVCQMLLNTYLTQAGTELQIRRSITRVDRRATTPLLEIAFEIVTHVSELGTIRQAQAVYDFAFQFLCHGLPAAVVLVEALQSMSRWGPGAAPLPAGVTKASMIRLLSVLASQLRTACEPRQINYTACVQASEAIGSSIDDILDGSPPKAVPLLPTMDVNGNVPENLSANSDPIPWSDSDIAIMLKDIDWNNISNEWEFL